MALISWIEAMDSGWAKEYKQKATCIFCQHYPVQTGFISMNDMTLGITKLRAIKTQLVLPLLYNIGHSGPFNQVLDQSQ